jgi:SAM-dependent methyltransferase
MEKACIPEDIRKQIVAEEEFEDKLNLASGADYIDGWVNIDINPDTKPDVVCNLDDPNIKLPFDDESFDFIYCAHILEHIRYLPHLKLELKRICKVPAIVVVISPYFTSMDAWGDDTHVRAFSEHSFFPEYWPGFGYQATYFVDVTDSFDNQNKWIVGRMVRQSGGEVRV